jgi:hypothetical protein
MSEHTGLDSDHNYELWNVLLDVKHYFCLLQLTHQANKECHTKIYCLVLNYAGFQMSAGGMRTQMAFTHFLRLVIGIIAATRGVADDFALKILE